MRLEVNGESREASPGTNLSDLLAGMGIEDPRGVAVAVEGEVVPRGKWEDTELSEGQRVEVLRAVQGG